MSTIDPTNVLSAHLPNYADAQAALREIASNTGKTVTVQQTLKGTTVNGNAIIKEKALDIVSLSSRASAVLSGQQIALYLIAPKNCRQQPISVPDSSKQNIEDLAAQAAQAAGKTADTAQADSPLGSSVASAQVSSDPMVTLQAYVSETPDQHFYGDANNFSEISSVLASNPERQASFINAYNNKTLNVQSASIYATSSFGGTSYYTESGSYTPGSPEDLDLSSLMNNNKNVIVLNDNIGGDIVVSW